MAITDIQISEELQAGAPSIKYRGNEGPKSPMETAMADPMLIEEYKRYVYEMEEQGREPVSFEQFVQEIKAGMAEGGRVPAAFGGIMDSSTGRRAYGWGSKLKSAAKSITRPVKKVLGSDLGKAALLYAGTAGLGNLAAGAPTGWGFGAGKGFNWLAPGNVMSNLSLAKSNMGNWLSGRRNLNDWDPARNIFQKGMDWVRDNRGLAALGLTTALPLTGIGMGEEETLDLGLRNIPDSQKFASDYSQMRKDIGDAVASGVEENFHEVLNKYGLTEGVNINYWEDIRKPSAQGGRIGYAGGGTGSRNRMSELMFKLANGTITEEEMIELRNIESSSVFSKGKAQGGRIGKAEGGIMNLGGMEKDYRNTGGFVDIGAKEKADDVPARLSVNEFVMTADAVRGAGGGDIDKGAEIMERVMKNLEEGGRISEESQGLKGAQEMFEVSERLSEVV